MTHNKFPDKSPAVIHTMFNMISREYDFLNNLMSFGIHNAIKLKCVQSLDIKPHANVIDLCCGTGDIARLIKKVQPNAIVTGIDFSENMLEIAKNKSEGIQYFQGDVTNLPYPDETFDIVTMGFGLRNINNAEKAVEEVYRILKPNGLFLHLDFGEKNILSRIFDMVIPIAIRLFTENTLSYKYLIESKKAFPIPSDLIKDFESKGFKLNKRLDFISGVISAQIMEKS